MEMPAGAVAAPILVTDGEGPLTSEEIVLLSLVRELCSD